MTEDAKPSAQAFRCPIDGRDLKSGEACPDHGIAFSEPEQTGRVIARTRPLSGSNAARKPKAKAVRK